MKNQIKNGTIAAAMLVALAGMAAGAHGQVRVWNAPAGGAWNVAANWIAPDAPDTGAESASITLAGPYTITLPSGYSPQIGALTITDSQVTLDRLDGGSFIASSISNNGVIRIGSGGPNGTYLRSLGNEVISGSGVLRLQASSNLETAAMYWNSNGGSEYFTQNAGHTIAGTGNIGARLDNAGLVNADVPGATLQLISTNKNNTGTMRASAGVLQLNGISVIQSGAGRVEATGGSVNLVSANISGGAVAAPSGSVNAASGTSSLTSVALSGTANILDGCSLQIAGGTLNNSGTILVNSGVGPSQAGLRALNGTQVISGNGSVVLRATTNLDTAVMMWNSNGGVETFTQNLGHTIRGTGNIHVALTNGGVVNADQNARILRLLSTTKSNSASGVMRASNGGTLDVNGILVTNAGVIEALPGSVVQLSAGEVTGGTLQTSGSGIIRSGGTSTLNSLTTNGSVFVSDGASLRATGTIVNNGVITVNETVGGSGTYFRPLNGNTTLNGTGSLVLTASANLETAALLWNSNGSSEFFTNGPSHTIRGTGNIHVVVVNNGLVAADVSGRTLQLLSGSKTNNATFRASNGGTLYISGIAVTNNNVIQALSSSVVHVNSSTITGGTLSTAGDGLFRTTGSSTLLNLTNNAPVKIADGASLLAAGTIVNNATITVNEAAGGSGTYFRALNGNTNLNGTGSLVLNASSNLETAAVYWNSNGTTEFFTNGASHTIRGTGNFHSALVNNGLVNADISGLTLQLLSGSKTNNATFRASNGGTLYVSGIAVTNTGIIEALSGSVVHVNGSTITGGTLSAFGDGLIRTTGTSLLVDLTNNAPVKVVDGNALHLTGTIVNNGSITLNETAGGSGTYLRTLNGNTVLNGTGSLILNASSNLETAAVYWNSNGTTEVFTNGASHTIGGTGNFYAHLTNNGTLSPGVTTGAIGRIHFASQPCSMTSTSRYQCDINGTAPTQYDRLTGGASLTLNGTLAVQFGYFPNISDQFDVVANPYTGRFSRLELPKGYYVEYLPSIVRVIFSGCLGDWDQDGDVDSDDVNGFFADFENGESDIDQDGDTDSDDIIEFFGRFESGC